jgi:hypothetical protein
MVTDAFCHSVRDGFSAGHQAWLKRARHRVKIDFFASFAIIKLIFYRQDCPYGLDKWQTQVYQFSLVEAAKRFC